jgi:hypothetical protein
MTTSATVTATKLVREKDIEQHLLRGVRALGGLCLKWVSPGAVGVPDRIVFCRGRITFVELKAPGKKPTAAQERMIERLRWQGADVVWLSSKQEVDDFLDPEADRWA